MPIRGLSGVVCRVVRIILQSCHVVYFSSFLARRLRSMLLSVLFFGVDNVACRFWEVAMIHGYRWLQWLTYIGLVPGTKLLNACPKPPRALIASLIG